MAGVDKLIVRNDAVLKRLPKKAAAGPPGTKVTVRAYDIASRRLPWLKLLDPVLYDHMYVEYDDGREPLIARGGPSSRGLLPFVRDGLSGRLRTTAEVMPAHQSEDFGRGERVLAQTFIPGRTAREVAQPAYVKAAQVRRGNNLYGRQVNSNSYAADSVEPIFGRRIGDEDTPGYETRLGDGELPEMVRRSQQALGQGFGSTAPGMFVYRLGEELGKRSPKMPMLPGY
ncbi:hypothetical protein [Phenylobacterium sp.]|uniref:hypothetical protein n=1 Tax=Phenylobacterium sp. TaxID=1871053 RepID=UPI00271D9C21|nr:hypothetical protein [Phenylobacterium sp.]MDO8380511.1 hypothetical protein [Phenylobacterium sp.]